MRIIIPLLATALLWSLAASAATYVVHPDGTGDFPTIQEAIDGATPGDTVALSNGTFLGTNNRNLNFYGKPLVLLSLSQNADSCVIDCQSAARGITFETGEDSTAVIRGIAFTNGSGSEGGAALLVDSSSPTFVRCTFVLNRASLHGGAVSCRDSADASFDSCAFVNNPGSPGSLPCCGGALYISSASPQFTSCAFSRNANGGAMYGTGMGGAFLAVEASPEFRSCTFSENSSGSHWSDLEGRGGAAYFSSSAGMLADCVFQENRAQSGSVLFLDDSSPTISGCTMQRNLVDGQGTVYLLNSPATITQCTIYGNNGAYGPSGLYSYGAAQGVITNTLVAFGDAWGVECVGGSLTLSCCDIYGHPAGDWRSGIEGQLGQNGNISEDPMFCDPESGDFTINSRSPCAPGCNPACDLIGAWPVGCSPVIHVVVPDGSGDFPTIQAAIDAARTGDIIELVDGTFSGSGNMGLELGGKALIVRSGSGDPKTCVIDCGGGVGFTFRKHESPASLEGVCLQAGSSGVECVTSHPTIERCIFQGNATGFEAAGEAAPTLVDCTFHQNEWSALEGHDDSMLDLRNCTIAENFAAGAEGSLFLGSGSSAVMDHCVVAFSRRGPAISTDAQVTLRCCNLYGNADGDWVGTVADQLGVDGNISEDPLFCDLYHQDFRLHSASPCAPGGSSECDQIGAWPVGCTTPAGPMTYQIRPDGGGDFPTIQAGLSVALSGDTLELAQGRYTGAGNRDLVFWRKGLLLRSQSAVPESCVVDCESSGRGLSFLFGEDSTTVVQGISFTAGRVQGGVGGGGIYCYRSSPRIVDCVFAQNSSDGNGGGGALLGGSAPRFEGCRYEGNYAVDGGGLYCNSSSPTVESSLLISNSASANGGAVFCMDASPVIRQSTLWGNLASTGGGLCLFESSRPVLEQTIISDCPDGGAIRLVSPSMPTLSCCDLFANVGGNWTGPIASQHGIRGNISADPWFCNPSVWDFHLAPGSPCLGGQCIQIGALGAGCGELAPQISSINDIPNDQGRQVRLAWSRSPYDGGRDIVIMGYAVYRRQDVYLRAGDGSAAPQLEANGAQDRTVRLEGWDCLGTVPARGDPVYQFVAQTLCDSTALGVCWSVFMVSATTQDPGLYFDSPPDSGYSIDNLAPGVPGNLRFSSESVLAWNEVPENDFDYFAVYGSSHAELDSMAVLIGQTTSTTWDTSGDPFLYYHVTATDFSGNEGGAASIENPGASGSGEGTVLPSRFALRAILPNPAASGVTVSYDVPVDVRVTLRIFDATGRVVATLVDGHMQAGTHRVAWEGKSSDDRRLALGLYFCRMDAGEFTETKKIVIAQ